jgi:two-component system CheB/CheR fusion protein
MVEREVRSSEGRWFMVRLLPYRTVEDRIDGVVLTFIEISGRKQTEEQLRGAGTLRASAGLARCR